MQDRWPDYTTDGKNCRLNRKPTGSQDTKSSSEYDIIFQIQPETAADTGKEVQAESSTATDGQAESCTATDGKAQELLNTENTGGTAEISIE